MLALSVSISTSSSPRSTESPSDFNHLRIVPSSIESERRRIATSAMPAGYTARAPGSSQAARSAGREPRDLEPEAVDGLDERGEVVEVEGLDHVAIDPAVVACRDVAGGGRRREHDHRHAPQVGVAADLLEHLKPVLLGQVEVEQDQVRPLGAG